MVRADRHFWPLLHVLTYAYVNRIAVAVGFWGVLFLFF
jgi:hypothetical protein